VELDELIGHAVRNGLASVEADAGPLIPFTMVSDGHPDPDQRLRYLDVFAAADQATGIELARASIRPNVDMSMYTVIYDGFASTASGRLDAVIVEAGSRERPEAVIVAQPYTTGRSGLRRRRRVTPVGEPVRVGTTPSLLWSPS
jgi:hypothetical protein